MKELLYHDGKLSIAKVINLLFFGQAGLFIIFCFLFLGGIGGVILAVPSFYLFKNGSEQHRITASLVLGMIGMAIQLLLMIHFGIISPSE